MTEPTAPGEVSLLRPAAAMTALTALSRATGFIRVLVVAAVLGTTYLGNTYQTANTVPNLLFELAAAGMLQAVLVPTLVGLLDRGRRDEAERVASSVLGAAALVLAALAAAAAIAAPWIVRALVSGVADPSIREQQVRLGTFFLWFFLPQVVLYAYGTVASAILNAHDRFALPVFAPVVNNVVVIGSYLAFWAMRDGAAPSLDLTTAEKVVLAGGTTLGVLLFCSVPVVAARRLGWTLRPSLDLRHPEVRALGRRGAWAGLYLALTQVVLGVVLVLCNRIEGGVVAFQVALTFFLLPHALFAIPVFTALYPTMSRQAHGERWVDFRRTVAEGCRVSGFFLLPATAAFMVLGQPLARLVLFGESAGAGADQVGRIVAALAPGLLGYGLFLLLTRAFYATGDARTPALVNLGLAVGGSALMVSAFAGASGDDRVPAVAAAHSLAYLLGCLALLLLLGRRVGAGLVAAASRPVGLSLVAAGASAGAMAATRPLVETGGRAGALATVGASLAAGAAAYLAVHRLAGPIDLRQALGGARASGSAGG